jgi:acyl-CoA synthetase (AMP-forming)/AMP-acid ligase II
VLQPAMVKYLAWTTLVEILQHRAQATPDAIAYGFLDGKRAETRCSYGELHGRALAMAERIRAVAKEDERVLVCLLPGLDYITAFFGCLYAGAVAVPVYPPQYFKSFDRIRAVVADARPCAAITATDILEKLAAHVDGEPAFPRIDWILADQTGATPAGSLRPAARRPDAIAFLQYTSGSTAAPKGVMLSHGNLLANLQAIQGNFRSHAGSVGCIWLPPYHDMGLIGGILQPLFAGFPVYLMSPMAFVMRPCRWLEAITRFAATISGGPNFAFDLCVSRIKPEEMSRLELGSWEAAFCGAEPIRASTLDAFCRKFAPVGFRRQALHPCYGLAEASLMVTGSRHLAPPTTQALDADLLASNVARPTLDRPSKTLVGCGHAIEGTEVLVVNPESRAACADGEIDEIWVRGPCVARGYYGRPEQSAETFGGQLADGRGPYLRTGDLGYLDHGELFVTGRIKDLIIVKGRNYYPQDIEHRIAASHPGLRSDGGVAFAIERADEECLVIVHEVEPKYPHDGLADAIPAIRRAVFEAFEIVPHDVVLVPRGSVARTSSGKLQRQLMKQRYLARNLDVVCRGGGEP